MAEPDRSLDFEGALAELEALVERMETGELSLEEALLAFERGVALTRQCQNALKHAELRVKALTEREHGTSLDELDDEDYAADDELDDDDTDGEDD